MLKIGQNKQRLIVEIGHTEEEYLENFGLLYDAGDLWDFPIEDVSCGAIEMQEDMVYWLIGSRIFETPIFTEK